MAPGKYPACAQKRAPPDRRGEGATPARAIGVGSAVDRLGAPACFAGLIRSGLASVGRDVNQSTEEQMPATHTSKPAAHEPSSAELARAVQSQCERALRRLRVLARERDDVLLAQ